jgi:hypothetical protein
MDVAGRTVTRSSRTIMRALPLRKTVVEFGNKGSAWRVRGLPLVYTVRAISLAPFAFGGRDCKS